MDEIEATAKPEPKPKPEPKVFDTIEKEEPPMNVMDNAYEIAQSIIMELPEKTLPEAYKELMRLNRIGVLNDDECPSIKQEMERALA